MTVDTDAKRCPECGSSNLSFGYGFAGGGGIGGYTFCVDCDCMIDKHVETAGSCLNEHPREESVGQ